MAVPAVVVKIAAEILTDEKARKKVGWIIAAILSPIILIVAAFLCISAGGAEHNASVVDASFFASGIAAETVPLEFKSHVEDMTHSFVSVDAAVAQLCQQMEGGDSLDAIRVRAVFYALFFGDSQPSTKNIAAFVNCFVTYETRTRTVTAENGSTSTETYTVAVPISDMTTVYANIGAAFGIEVTEDDGKNADNIYARIRPAGDTHAGDVLRGDGDGLGLDTSAFRIPEEKNNPDLAAYAVSAYESGWGYVWGTFGSVLTESLYQSKLAQYPDGVGKYAEFIKTNWFNKRTTDCVGLIKGYGWLDADTGSIRYGSALERVLADSGTNTQTVMQARLMKLYTQYVPSRERIQINECIEGERLAAERHAEESRRISCFRVVEHGSCEYFCTEKPYEFLHTAKLLRNYLTKVPDAAPVHFEEMFTPHSFISPDEYDELVSTRMENTGKVVGAFNIDFDKREFSAVNIMDGWKTFAMDDVGAAVYYAFRKMNLTTDQRWDRLLEKLDGKEITSAGHLSCRNFSFSDEIIADDGKLNFYLDTDFDVDAVFGANVCTDKK